MAHVLKQRSASGRNNIRITCKIIRCSWNIYEIPNRKEKLKGFTGIKCFIWWSSFSICINLDFTWI
jgi:hypothetical protein